MSTFGVKANMHQFVMQDRRHEEMTKHELRSTNECEKSE
jgi:hypothetical protein